MSESAQCPGTSLSDSVWSVTLQAALSGYPNGKRTFLGLAVQRAACCLSFGEAGHSAGGQFLSFHGTTRPHTHWHTLSLSFENQAHTETGHCPLHPGPRSVHRSWGLNKGRQVEALGLPCSAEEGECPREGTPAPPRAPRWALGSKGQQDEFLHVAGPS